MKILHITASYKPAFIYGGPIYSVAALCEELCEKKQGFGSAQPDTVQVYTTLANGKEELPYQNGETKIIEGVKVTYFKRITNDHSHFSPDLMVHLWRSAKNFDVIHIHSWWNLVSMGAVLVCLLRGIKPVLSPRGMLGDYSMSNGKSIFHRFIGKYFLRRCVFHATTLMEAAEILQQVFGNEAPVIDLMGERSQKYKVEQGNLNGAPSLPIDIGTERVGVRQIFVIHNIVKLPVLLPQKARVFDGTLRLIFLSRVHHKKGIELLLDALALVGFPFKLCIVGEGEADYVDSLKRKAESLKLSEHIKWIGAVYGEEKYQLLADHDAFILPSYNENFANVVIEAIAVGTPVFLSEHVGLKDYVKANNFGLVFKLAELKETLDKAYSLFSEKESVFNQDLSVIRESLTDKYLEMYANAENGRHKA